MPGVASVPLRRLAPRALALAAEVLAGILVLRAVAAVVLAAVLARVVFFLDCTGFNFAIARI